MNNQNKLAVGLIGVGNSGKEHLNYYKKNKNVTKIFINEKKKIYIENNKKIQIDKKFKEFSKLTKKNIVSISNYDSDHSKYIKKYYKRNHIFVEKPMCRSFKELNEIVKISKKNKFKNLLTSNLVLREAEIFKKITKELSKNSFGKIYYFEADYLYGRLKKITNGWRGKDSNYSVTLGGGIHLIDLMITFFNEVPAYVTSYANKIVTKNKNFKFNDFVQSNYFFRNGAIAKISSNFGCVHKHQHVVKIYGTKKTFIYDDKGARVYNRYDPAPYISKKIKKLYSGKDCLLPNFFKKIKYEKNFKKSIMKEINLMSVALSSELSLKKNCKVKVKYYK